MHARALMLAAVVLVGCGKATPQGQVAAASDTSAGRGGAPAERPDAGEQLPKIEGLDEVVVRARVKAAYPIRRRIARASRGDSAATSRSWKQ